jgi:parallel beta-helix repeat protein
MKFRRFCTLSCFLACSSVTTSAFAATLIVDNDFVECPQADFSSIQEAVTAAHPGDKILVCPGIYPETVEVSKSDLRIEAQAAPGEVVLEGSRTRPVGFHLLNTTGVLLQGFTVRNFTSSNVRIEGSSVNTSSGNTVRKNISTLLVGPAASSSIQVLNSSNNVVEQNTAFGNCSLCNGISVAGAASSDNIVRHNETFLNGQAGVQTNASGPRNVLFGNRSHDNAIGIRNIFASNETVIENNHVFANGSATAAVSGGIIVGMSTLVTVRNNRSERNAAFGIRLQNGSTNNLVEKNEVFENNADGIRLEPTVAAGTLPVTGNVVQLNHVRGSGRDGIRVFSSLAHDNTIERNVIRESAEHDAHDDSVGAGTGGTANLWIENKCETENRPELCKNP